MDNLDNYLMNKESPNWTGESTMDSELRRTGQSSQPVSNLPPVEAEMPEASSPKPELGLAKPGEPSLLRSLMRKIELLEAENSSLRNRMPQSQTNNQLCRSEPYRGSKRFTGYMTLFVFPSPHGIFKQGPHRV